jgi:hypothetical protein
MARQHIDPATGRPYTVDPATGQSSWVDQPQQPWTPPQRPQKTHTKRNIILGSVAGILLLGVISAAIGGGDPATTTTQPAGVSTGAKPAGQPAQPPAKPAAKTPGIGTPVRDGKFQFTVTRVKPGPARIGSEYLGKTAQGRYVLVTVRVENIGDRQQMFDGSSQKGFDAQDRAFSADTEAGIYLGAASKSFLTQINPGNTVTGVIVFDVPKGATLTRLELHDSMFSGGVEVRLG